VKKLLRWLFKLLFLLAALVGLLLLFRHSLVRALLEREIRKETGMEAFIGEVDVGLRSPVLLLQNLRLFNPPGFDRGVFADFPDVYLEYDREALWHRQLRIRALRLDLFEIHFQRNREGKSNFQLMAEQSRQRRAAPPSWPDLRFEGIDSLNLTLGRLKYTDHKDPSKNDEVWLGVRNGTARNVSSLKDLEPFLAKLASEKNLLPLFEQLFNLPRPSPAKPAPAPVPPEAPAAAEPAAR
jgi:uncharacterized protein involved in outer membrane biogenesis